MLKKSFIAVFLILATLVSTIITTSMPIFADTIAKANNKGGSPIVEILNNIDGVKTFEKSYALCVRAKEGTVITFQQYWFKTDEEKSVVLKKKQSENSLDTIGEWVLQDKTEQWEIGASSIYARSVTWKLGRNKIVLKAKDKNGNTETLTMLVELVDKKQVNDFLKSYILKNIGESLD